MSKRTINLNDYARHEAMREWLVANDLDPKRLPINQVVEVGDGTLRATEFTLSPDGHKQIGADGEPLKATFVCSLLSAPENHGL